MFFLDIHSTQAAVEDRKKGGEQTESPCFDTALPCLSFLFSNLAFWRTTGQRRALLFSASHPCSLPGQGAGEEKRGRDCKQDFRFLLLAAQLSVSPSSGGKLVQPVSGGQEDSLSRTYPVGLQRNRRTGGVGVMASVDSTGSSVSGRLRSGDLIHAGLAAVLLLGELDATHFIHLVTLCSFSFPPAHFYGGLFGGFRTTNSNGQKFLSQSN